MNAKLAAFLDSLRAEKDPNLLIAMAHGASQGQRQIRVFSMAGGKPRLLKDLNVPEGEVAAVREGIGGSGVPMGVFHSRHLGWIWTETPERFRLWSNDGLALEGREGQLQLADGSRIPASEVEGVEPYVTPNWFERGVRLMRRGATPVTVASMTSVAAEVDPTYDDESLNFETGWARVLARTLADWLRVRYVEPQWADTPSFS